MPLLNRRAQREHAFVIDVEQLPILLAFRADHPVEMLLDSRLFTHERIDFAACFHVIAGVAVRRLTEHSGRRARAQNCRPELREGRRLRRFFFADLQVGRLLRGCVLQPLHLGVVRQTRRAARSSSRSRAAALSAPDAAPD